MRIGIIAPEERVKGWIKTFKNFDKNIDIAVYPDMDYNDIDCVCLWKHPKKVLGEFKNLKLIHSMGAGVDHILKLKNYNKKIPVIRIKDEEMGERIANYSLAQILNYQLNFKIFQNSQIKQYWSGERTPIDNKNLTVGILGLGFLGNHIAKLLNKLNYNVIAYKKNRARVKNVKIYTGKNIISFIKNSDVIISILPSTAQTNNIIDKKFLKNMKKNSCLINIGRGNAIEEKDLLNHLKKNKNFYAYLDVFKDEPLKSSSQFWKLPNVTITPHVAGVTAIEPSVKYMYSKYKKLRKNKNVKSDVNPSDGY